ncbi:uncharacterized protein SAPINGB_P005515 [Magnusiomyces paraingens]|uniref:Sedlin n=1 Tax=Magnusiomyces paraingens TaxID=2606893 RepID=A0A5E8C0Z3_9ASCO|nr:uncharacterized protein SAPINGB_P005515 [Saprochaete ingens]VVT57062.1 unnamed protein product [Saprochaete ingens]
MPVIIRFVSVIGSNNSPLYIRGFNLTGEEEDGLTADLTTNKELLQYHFLSHMALDYVVSQLSHTESTKDYALLLVHSGIAVFGSLTNTGIKILIGIDAQESVRADLRTTMRLLNRAYISYICNPFKESKGQQQITSKAFNNQVRNIVNAWNSAAAGFM